MKDKNHCRNGHLRSAENTYQRPRNGRVYPECKDCRRAGKHAFMGRKPKPNCVDCGKPVKYYLAIRCHLCFSRWHGGYNRARPFEHLYKKLLKCLVERNQTQKPIPTECMSFEEFLTFVGIADCHYCGGSIAWAKYGNRRCSQKYNLDRKDNACGYVIDNCVVCCVRCNRMKRHDVPYEVFLKIGDVLREAEGRPPRQLWSTDKAA